MDKKKKSWSWHWVWDPYSEYRYVDVHWTGAFPFVVTWAWAVFAPDSFGHWLGRIAQAMKAVL